MRWTKCCEKPAKQASLRPIWHLLLFSAFLTACAFSQDTTIRSRTNVVLIPALVKDSHDEVVYGLQASDFIIEDDGVEQPVHLDETPEGQPISLVVAIQTGRRAADEFPRMQGLKSMLDPLFGRDILSQGTAKVALVEFDSQVNLTQNFTDNADLISGDLSNIRPGDGGAAILDAVAYSVKMLGDESEGRLRVLLLISETRDHGSHSKIETAVTAVGQANAVIYALTFSPSKSNVLDTLRGNNNPDLHPEKTEMHNGPDLLAPFVLAAQAMRKNIPATIASMTGGEYELFATRRKFDVRVNDFDNHLHSRYLLSITPKNPHAGLHQIRVSLKDAKGKSVLARTRYWAEGTSAPSQ